LWDLPGLVVTPHLAGSLGREIQRLGRMAVEEIERYAAGDAPRDPVTRADLGRIA
jgi:phosphoglycerate dehydrogenase-like enzyme